MGSSVIQLVVLGIVALFLILKLRRALGTRDGFEKVDRANTSNSAFTGRPAEAESAANDSDITDFVSLDSESGRALSAMKQADDTFKVQEFMDGASRAYEMILLDFAGGNLDNIEPFISEEVYESFGESIQHRKENELTHELRFVRLVKAELREASLSEQNEADITIEFVAELISFVTDGDGEIVEGDDKAVRTQRDVWTFAREMTSSDPNWCLVETGD